VNGGRRQGSSDDGSVVGVATMTDAVGDRTSAISIAADVDAAFYWDGADGRRLVVQRCDECHKIWHPPGPVCPHCQCLNWTVDDLPLEGVLYATAKVHEPGSPIQGTGYLIALVEIADPLGGEGVRIAGNLRDATLEEARVGAAVMVCFEQLADGHLLPQFRLQGRRES
jgi:uncharacterized OB-fold protein